MNEQIRLLAEQAMGTRKHVPPVWQFYDDELEKFAQLIVKECALVAADVVVEHEGVEFGLVAACYRHFGVAE